MTKHQKHAKLSKPHIGSFHRNEISILGTPCGNIKKLAYQVINKLSPGLNVAYVDADHKSADEGTHNPDSSISFGAAFEYIDKIDFHRFDSKEQHNEYTLKRLFGQNDFVLVNGNHFEANCQIVVIDPKKSLEKKLHKLTNVQLILLVDGVTSVPEYIEHHIKDHGNVPRLSISDLDEIERFILSRFNQSVPGIKGLVLAGGKSQRMKRDKAEISYHGMEHRSYMYQLLSELTEETFVSIRSDQNLDDNGLKTLSDTFFDLGPYGAILSAFRSDPNSAWLVTACDQPFLDKITLKKLIEGRNPSKLATAFYNPQTDFPEPLVTIWEPRAYERLLYFLSIGYSCPRKVLINSNIEMIRLDDDLPLVNVNTPEEYEVAIGKLNKVGS